MGSHEHALRGHCVLQVGRCGRDPRTRSSPTALVAVLLLTVQDGVCQLLSLILRLYVGNKNNPTVLNTASATVRQVRMRA